MAEHQIILRDTPDLERHFADIQEGEHKIFLKPSGPEGIKITLRAMRFFVERDKANPKFVQFVHNLLQQVPAKNKTQEAYCIYDWVRKNFRYEKDPVGIEMVISPFRNLKDFWGSDCDCQSTFVATALEIIGIPTRFVAVKVGKANRYSHVYVEAYLDNQWTPIDTTTKLTKFGEEYSKITEKMVWPVYKENITGKIAGLFSGINNQINNINDFVLMTGKVELPQLKNQLNKKFIKKAIQNGLGVELDENAPINPLIFLVVIGALVLLGNKK